MRSKPYLKSSLLSFALVGSLFLSPAQAAVGDPCGQQPLNLCIMLDRTGSVTIAGREKERDAAKDFMDKIAALNNGSRVAVGRFGDQEPGETAVSPFAEIIAGLGLTVITPQNIDALKALVDTAMSTSSPGNTNIEDAIEACREELRLKDDGKPNVIIFISEGEPNLRDPAAENTAENDDHNVNHGLTNANFNAAYDAAQEAKGEAPFQKTPPKTLNPGYRIFSIAFDNAVDADHNDDRLLMARMASGNTQDDHCDDVGDLSCDPTEIAAENTDRDALYISPSGTDLNLIVEEIFQVLQCQADANQCTIELCNEQEVCDSEEVPSCIPCQSASQCNDGNVCTNETCTGGRCLYGNNANGTSCSEGNGCTENDACQNGLCRPGTPKACNDGRACSADFCAAPTGLCDFNLAMCRCNSDQDCPDDGNACTDQFCDLGPGLCVNVPDDSNTCSDSNACTANDHCSGGQCLSTPVTCADNNPCTDDTCNPSAGCAFVNNDTNACTDNDGCTLGEHCLGGSCVPGDPPDNLKVCDDTFACSADRCVSPLGQCDFNLEGCECFVDDDCIAMDDGNSCTDEICINNQCVNAPNDLNSCSDLNACTNNDHCAGSVCVGSAVTCNDNNPCTDDFCDAQAGCQFLNNDANLCTDNDECTVSDRCENGLCTAGLPKTCNDHRSCSTDRCLQPTGLCDFNLENCSCNEDDDCDDNNSCTDDVCNFDTGVCSNFTNNANACNDANACTGGDHCEEGLCLGTPVACEDDNPCTDNSCNPAVGCEFKSNDGNACADDNGCTLGDHCENGVCVSPAPLVCDDHRSCSTSDECLAPSGQCRFTLSQCACSADTHCNDGNSCTDDSCDLNTGFCVNTANDTNACGDSNACTENDHCAVGLCVGTAVVCSDGNACTDDVCNPDNGCEFKPDDANVCSDENECSLGDHCESGACVPITPKVCDDNNPLTDDACADVLGQCLHAEALSPRPTGELEGSGNICSLTLRKMDSKTDFSSLLFLVGTLTLALYRKGRMGTR